jgi:hypothetical protein
MFVSITREPVSILSYRRDEMKVLSIDRAFFLWGNLLPHPHCHNPCHTSPLSPWKGLFTTWIHNSIITTPLSHPHCHPGRVSSLHGYTHLLSQPHHHTSPSSPWKGLFTAWIHNPYFHNPIITLEELFTTWIHPYSHIPIVTLEGSLHCMDTQPSVCADQAT